MQGSSLRGTQLNLSRATCSRAAANARSVCVPQAFQRRRFQDITQALRQRNVKGVSPKMAQLLSSNQEYVLIDVRPGAEHVLLRPDGVKHVPLFKEIEGVGAEALLRKVVLGMLGVSPTIENPYFKEHLLAALQGSRGVIFGDLEGGALEPQPGFPNGKISRSLVAAHVLLEEIGGYQGDVRYVLGGWRGWFEQGLPGRAEAGAFERKKDDDTQFP